MLIRPLTTRVLAILEASPTLNTRTTASMEQLWLAVGQRLSAGAMSLHDAGAGACETVPRAIGPAESQAAARIPSSPKENEE